MQRNKTPLAKTKPRKIALQKRINAQEPDTFPLTIFGVCGRNSESKETPQRHLQPQQAPHFESSNHVSKEKIGIC